MAAASQPTQKAEAGAGEIVAQTQGYSNHCVSKISKLHSSYPLRLISPRPPPESPAVLVFMLTFGGGLVAGDQTRLSVQVLENARLGLLTQGSTRAYKSPSRDIVTRQALNVRIEPGAALVLLPDPIQPFKDSVFEQRQIFEIDRTTSNLLLLDWVSEGRTSRGESWQFTSWKTRNEIWSTLPSQQTNDDAPKEKRNLLLRDNIKLPSSTSSSAPGLAERMEGLGVFGTLILTGPLFKELGIFFLETYSRRPRIGEKIWAEPESTHPPNGTKQSNNDHDDPQQRTNNHETGLKWTVTQIRDIVIIKFGAEAVQQARRWLREMLVEEGTVEKEFGHSYLYCLQDR